MGGAVVAAALELVAIREVAPLLSGGGSGPFSAGELAYARSKSDPERRLAARLAAKRAARSLCGAGVELSDFEVEGGRGGPPRLLLSARAASRLLELNADSVLVSLSHGREHAVASVLLLRRRL
jgi:holo-[acyl-carrier protein] synthase